MRMPSSSQLLIVDCVQKQADSTLFVRSQPGNQSQGKKCRECGADVAAIEAHAEMFGVEANFQSPALVQIAVTYHVVN